MMFFFLGGDMDISGAPPIVVSKCDISPKETLHSSPLDLW